MSATAPGVWSLPNSGFEPQAAGGDPLGLRGADGVAVGTWPLPLFRGRARHAAIAVRQNGAVQVTELVGPPERQLIGFHHEQPQPKYGPFAKYTWVPVAGPDAIGRVRSAVSRQMAFYSNFPYLLIPGASNFFVDDVLNRAGISLSPQQNAALGCAPGLTPIWHCF
jgi:hypothetical protein